MPGRNRGYQHIQEQIASFPKPKASALAEHGHGRDPRPGLGSKLHSLCALGSHLPFIAQFLYLKNEDNDWAHLLGLL